MTARSIHKSIVIAFHIAMVLATGLATTAFASSKKAPWSDSYSVGGQCYCDTNYDHGLRSYSVRTPIGIKSVPKICADIRKKFGKGRSSGRTYYNTVQCGHGPSNDARDERVCPGIPKADRNYTGPRCNDSGATWNLGELYSATKPEEPKEPEEPVEPDEPVEPEEPEEPVEPEDSGAPESDESDTDRTDVGTGSDSAKNTSDSSDTADPGSVTVSPDTASAGAMAEFVCIDYDGDGYGFANGESCRVDGLPVFPEDSRPLLNADICIDFDGDGWGYANNESCRVDPQSTKTEIADDVETEPGCIDHDGDGYGFANGASCRVDGKPVFLEDSSPVLGADICIDYDGDGWGESDGVSCRVALDDGADASTGISCGRDNAAATYDSAMDLLVLHYDFGRDPDDGHAALANKIMLDIRGITNPLVVGGTNSLWQNNYLSGTDSLLNRIYGEGGWDKANILDSESWNAAVSNSTEHWLQALSGNGHIWIAEAGPSDFTREVLQNVRNTYDACTTKTRIHVVQHSAASEANTGRDLSDNRDDDLAYLQSNSHYVKIDDGNALNGTANLHANDATIQQNANFVDKALASIWSDEWRAAFEFLPPGLGTGAAVSKLDFSDSVEILHILQIPLGDVSDWDDFANSFF